METIQPADISLASLEHSCDLPDPTSSAIDSLAMRVAIDKDAIISQALSDYLGHSEWESHEMDGRLSCSILRADDSEVWSCDGVPLVTFYPPSLDSAGTRYIVDFKYVRHNNLLRHHHASPST